VRRWNKSSLTAAHLDLPNASLSALHDVRRVAPRVKLARADADFLSLGAQAEWLTADGFGDMGDLCTTMRHSQLGIVVELPHRSFGAFKFAYSSAAVPRKCAMHGEVLPLPADGSEVEWEDPDVVAALERGEGKGLMDRFGGSTSLPAGRWVVVMGVPNVTISNSGDFSITLHLTPNGFFFSGGGPAAVALVVEDGAAPFQLSVTELGARLRHQPMMPDEPTEVDEMRARAAARREKIFAEVPSHQYPVCLRLATNVQQPRMQHRPLIILGRQREHELELQIAADTAAEKQAEEQRLSVVDEEQAPASQEDAYSDDDFEAPEEDPAAEKKAGESSAASQRAMSHGTGVAGGSENATAVGSRPSTHGPPELRREKGGEGLEVDE